MTENLDEEIIEEFVSESLEHLESIEPDLLVLEKGDSDVDVEIINRIFRAMHSIKGASGFLGFDTLTELSHAMENIFMKFRDDELVPEPEIMDPIFEGIDKVRNMLENIYTSNDISCEEELKKINGIIWGKKGIQKNGEASSQAEISEGGFKSLNNPLIKEFVNESLENLDLTFQDLIIIQKKLTDPPEESIRELLKAVVLIKNGARFLNFDRLYKMGHLFEKIYTAILGKELLLDKEKGSFLVTSFQKMQEFLENIDNCEKIQCHDEIAGLYKIIGVQEELSDKTSNIEPAIDLKEHKVVSATTEDKIKSDITSKSTQKIRTGAGETIRVSVNLIDNLMNLAGELVLGRNQLRQELEFFVRQNPKLNTIIQNVDAVTSEIQEDIMQMRMQPVGNLFNKFSRIVRDLSRQLSKQIDLVIEGKDVELDKTMLEGLSDPLTHLIRNSLDHGIELPDEREKKNKNRVGTLEIKTFHEGGQVIILVKDDGRGIHPEEIAQKAVEKGLVARDRIKTLSDHEKINLIMMPGFSMTDEITDISGRGVGMDVVKTNIENIGGQLEIDTVFGKGTTVRIRLPLTLAIIPSLIVGAGRLQFAIPQVNVKELFLIRAGENSRKIEKVGDAEVLRVRERLLPLVNLSHVLGLEKKYYSPDAGEESEDRRKMLADRREPNASQIENETLEGDPDKRIAERDRRKSWRSDINVVVLKIGINTFGLIVDQLYDNEEIVVKPLSTHIKDCKCFAGATIMGDGRVAMILDAVGVAEYSSLDFDEVHAEEVRRNEIEEQKKQSIVGHRESILLFNYALNEYFALTLDCISRLEKVTLDSIYKIGSKSYVKYRELSVPIAHMDEYLPVNTFPDDLDEFYIIIPKTAQEPVGIAVSRILDTLAIGVDIKRDKSTPKGLLGTAFVNDELTMFLDTDALLDLIYDIN